MKIYVADFETQPFDDSKTENYQIKARFVCFIEIFSNKRLFFDIEHNGLDKLKKFIYSLCSVKNPIRIYFHNLRFDIAFLYESLPKDYDYELIFSGSKLINLRVFKNYERKNNKNYRSGKIYEHFLIEKKTVLDIRDSLPLFVNSIEKLGKSVLLPKLDIDYFSKEINEKYIEYCYRDIEIVKRALALLKFMLIKYFNYNVNIVDLPLTIASLGKRVFHFLVFNQYSKENNLEIYNKLNYILYNGKKSLKVDNPLFLLIYHKSIDVIESDFRENYFGGRVEVFDFNILNDGNYNDINSEYPSIMLENDFPIPPYKKKSFINSKESWIEYLNNNLVFACKCEVQENLNIPLVPTKYKVKDNEYRIIYGNGKKTSILFRKEIDYLVKNNQNVKILDLYYCSMYLSLFNEFITKGYSLKSNFIRDTFENYFGKIFMNSVYGKFAEKRIKEIIEILNTFDYNLSEIELNKLSFTEKGILKREFKEVDNLKTNIVFSCMITALGRLKIYEYVMKSKVKNYVDTDSIVSKEAIEKSELLGKMKVEFSFKRFQALGCKEYIIMDKDNKILIKMKGFGKIDVNCDFENKTEIEIEIENKELFNDFILNFYEGKKQSRMVGFLESFKRNLPFNTILVFEKFKESTYYKRWINNDLTTLAFHLQNDSYSEMIENNSKIMKKLIDSYF